MPSTRSASIETGNTDLTKTKLNNNEEKIHFIVVIAWYRDFCPGPDNNHQR